MRLLLPVVLIASIGPALALEVGPNQGDGPAIDAMIIGCLSITHDAKPDPLAGPQGKLALERFDAYRVYGTRAIITNSNGNTAAEWVFYKCMSQHGMPLKYK